MQLAERLAQNLKRRRGSLTQQAFARKLGISRASLNRLENCAQNTTITTLQRICDALRCDIHELLEPPGRDA